MIRFGRRSARATAALVACAMLSVPSPSRAEPRGVDEAIEALRLLLLRETPPGSAYHFGKRTRAAEGMLRTLTRTASKLPDFAPLEVIALEEWSPNAGYPGVLRSDLRIVRDPERGTFAVASREWLAAWRADHPVSVDSWTEAHARAYFEQLVRLTPRLDAYGFKLKSFRGVGPRRYVATYRATRDMGPARADTLEFTLRANGDLERSERLLSEPRPTGF